MSEVSTTREEGYGAFISTALLWVVISVSIFGCLFKSTNVILNGSLGLVVTFIYCSTVAIGVNGNKLGYKVLMYATAATLSVPLIFKLLLSGMV
jgi:hypothetical protein